MASSPNTGLGAQVSSGENYRDDFDPQAYLHYYEDVREFHTHPIKLVHELFHSYGSTSAGLKVLDYGAGPIVFFAISAARQASEIVLSEYTEKNRDAIQHWLKKAPEAHDWTPFFKYVVQDLEGLGEEEVTKRQEDVRTLLTVVKCDIHQDPPIQSGYEGPYDVILSSLCLESACTSVEDYAAAVTKLSMLLKPGGKIGIRFVETGGDNAPTNFYMVGAERFVSLTVPESAMRNALEKAGFYNITFERQLRTIPEEESNFHAMTFVTATRK